MDYCLFSFVGKKIAMQEEFSSEREKHKLEEGNGLYKSFFDRGNYLCFGAGVNGKDKDVAGENYGSFGLFGSSAEFFWNL